MRERGARSEEVGCFVPQIVREFEFVSEIFSTTTKTTKILFIFFQMPPSLHAQLSPTSRSYQGILRRLIPTSHGLQYLQNQVKNKQTNKTTTLNLLIITDLR